jgi:GNAT superfamily N-acetyltransferase
MALVIRPIAATDAVRAGQICHDAFGAIAGQHNFPPDFPDPQVAIDLFSLLVTHPGFHGIVAERDGVVVGSNFIDERGAIIGLGPITVEPGAQNRGVGTALMTHMIDRAARNRAPGLRLLQSGYHARSLCLYTKLGFAVREPVVNLQGQPPRVEIAGCRVRPATEADADACNRLCREVHGHDRAGELRDAIAQKTASVVERAGRITGYTTQIAFFGHAVAVSNDDLKALVAASPSFAGPGFLLPSRNTELFRWCLDQGLRMVQPLTLMTIGLYSEPKGAWLPSILY